MKEVLAIRRIARYTAFISFHLIHSVFRLRREMQSSSSLVLSINGVEGRDKRGQTVFSAPQVLPRCGDPPPEKPICLNPKALVGERFCAVADENVRAWRHVLSFGTDGCADNGQTVAECVKNFDAGPTAAPQRNDNRVRL
jgi:hypothetical protein